jgi:hypothetical protein
MQQDKRVETMKNSSPTPGTSGTVKLLMIALVTIMLCIEGWLGYRLYKLSDEQKHIKLDYAFVNNAAYGLFSVDSWRNQLVAAAKDEVKDFRLTPEQKKELRNEIRQVLDAMVNHTFEIINRKQTSLRGKLRKFVVKTFVKREKIDNQVPALADKLVAEITKPANYQKLATIADTALSRMGKEVYDSTVAANKQVMDSVYHRHAASDRASFERKTADRLEQITSQTSRYSMGMLACICMLLLTWLLLRKRRSLHVSLFLLSLVSAIILLTVGLSTTMLEIDARIAKMELHFLDKTISFEDQGLFFQSKSIVDVVILLFETGRLDSQAVGMLILVFSVLFPFMKLGSASMVLMSEKKWAKNRIVRWFAFESGKWSIADVMVIAILMTFIGFNGIVVSKLETMNYHDLPITSITTTNTTVQPGYIIFIAFVIYSFVLSGILAKIMQRHETKSMADQPGE